VNILRVVAINAKRRYPVQLTSIIFDFITKKIKGGTKYIVKLILYMISGVIGSVILSTGHNLDQLYIFTTIVAILYFLIDELNATFIYKK
jgi:TctA family transporter